MIAIEEMLQALAIASGLAIAALVAHAWRRGRS